METVMPELIEPPHFHEHFKFDRDTNRWIPAQTHTISCILDGLYISDLEGAFDTKVLESLGISHVLSVLELVNYPDFRSRFPRNITVETIQISDDQSVNIGEHFPAAIEFISKVLRNRHARNMLNSPKPPFRRPVYMHSTSASAGGGRGGVLVHCHLGMSRSVTIVTAFVMYALSMDWLPALRAVQREHATSFPSLSFARQLAQWGHHLESTRVAQQALRNSLWGSTQFPPSSRSSQ
ncbi:hypothetical protein Pelo_14419 [Pelomyxa schiedti]|nr:hypothetical protein Pelo_14419 [Pelomyxa schiedti]